MNRYRSFIANSLLALCLLSTLAQARSADDIYKSFCASCHGPDMSGGLGPSLRDAEWKHGSTDADISRVIKQGVPKVGMPAMEKTVTDADIRALIILIRESAAKAQAPASTAEGAVIEGGGHKFKLEKVASAPGELWSIDFLEPTTLVATQKDGKLWVFKNGERQGPVVGIPEVFSKGQGGLLEVQRHPDPQSAWIYLTYSDAAAGNAMTKVVRGKLDGLKWVEQQTIYSADSKFYTDRGHHFGSRMVFQDGYIYFSVGDRGVQDQAQDLSHPNGKVHRLHDDGRVPKDNPHAANAEALPSIWSYGHRNPQGLAVHPQTGDIWEAEHGPRGGDEINRLVKGANFGWPVITYGMNYNGTPITSQTTKAGMEQPKHYWVPSIAISEIDFYTGEPFPKWRHQMLVGSLAKEQLRLVRIQGDQVVSDELLFQDLGRIRDLADGPDGFPYVVLNQNDGGAIYRLVPAE
jgi:glucose/arabinose dehydrogenase